MTKLGLNGQVVSMFVDDIKVMALKESGIIQCMKVELAATFSMIDTGLINFYLGPKIERDQAKRTIKLSQPAYINKVLSKFHLD